MKPATSSPILALAIALSSCAALSAQGQAIMPAPDYWEDSPMSAVAPEVIESPSVMYSQSDGITEYADNGNFGFAGAYNPNLPWPVQGAPAPIDSTRDWVDNGRWYFRSDLVLYHLDLVEAVPIALDTSQIGTVLVRRNLVLGHGALGLEPLAKLTLGRTMFRDTDNRTHSTEFTFLGLGDWSVRSSIQSVNVNSLTSLINPFAPGFNGVDVYSYEYGSNFNSFEWNYRVQRRLGRDRMVLHPNGCWSREATASKLHSYLWGIRVLEIDEDFLLETTSIPALNNSGTARVSTDNVLVGSQVGGEFSYQTARWSAGVSGKAGGFVNFSGRQIDIETFLGGVQNNFQSADSEEKLAFVGEVRVFGRYHFRPNFSYHAAFEALFTSSIALAADQLTLNTLGSESIRSGGGQMYLGMSTGFDFVW